MRSYDTWWTRLEKIGVFVVDTQFQDLFHIGCSRRARAAGRDLDVLLCQAAERPPQGGSDRGACRPVLTAWNLSLIHI